MSPFGNIVEAFEARDTQHTHALKNLVGNDDKAMTRAPREPLRVGSLFSGIGGFDLAVQRAGATLVWFCEKDAAARSVLARHWPEVPCYDDVSAMRGAKMPPVDLLCGGFPCQDLSVAGRRAGLAGDRSGLWFEFLRVAQECAPAWVLIENVPGLLSSRRGADFGVLLAGLVERGYRVAWRVLDAQHFGLAQRRKRVFVVGHRGDGRAAAVLFEPESLRGDSPARGAAREGVAGSLGGGTPGRGWSGDTDRMTFLPVVSFGGNKSASQTRRVDHTAPALQASPTSTPAVGVRRLMPVECERLQGFPDGWTDGQSDSARYRQLGNAVAVPVVEWIARRIVEREGGT